MRLPAEPPPGPKENQLELDGDCRKNGDAMFPTGTLLFVRLKMLVAFTERLSEYGRWTAGFAGGF